MADPKKLIGLSMIGTAVVVGLHHMTVEHSAPAPHDFVAPAAIYLVLAFLAGYDPKLASSFAVLVFVSVVVLRGPELWSNLHIGTEAAPAPPAPTTGSSTTSSGHGKGQGSGTSVPTSGGGGKIPKGRRLP